MHKQHTSEQAVVKCFIYNKMPVSTQTRICNHANTLKPSLKQINTAVEFILGILKLQSTTEQDAHTKSNAMSQQVVVVMTTFVVVQDAPVVLALSVIWTAACRPAKQICSEDTCKLQFLREMKLKIIQSI